MKRVAARLVLRFGALLLGYFGGVAAGLDVEAGWWGAIAFIAADQALDTAVAPPGEAP